MRDDFRQRAVGECYDRLAHGHRLDIHQSKRLGRARMHENVHRRQGRPHILKLTCPMHPIFKTELGAQSRQTRLVVVTYMERVAANHQKATGRRGCRELARHLQKNILAFRGPRPAHHADDGRLDGKACGFTQSSSVVSRNLARVEAGKVDAVVEGGQFGGAWQVLGDCV